MQRLIICIGLLVFAIPGIRAQETVDFSTINMETYRLYLAGEWDSVIIMGRQAIKKDMDFYYLRMRMGVACYQEKNYRKAASHFSRALEMNQDEPAALEQLYYAHLMSGKGEQSSLVRMQFKGELALSLPPPKAKFADRIGGEYFYSKGLNEDLMTDPGSLFDGLPAGVQYISRYFSNYHLSLVNSIIPGFTLTHAYNYLSKTNLYHYNDGVTRFEYADQHASQHQYYISPTITTRSGFVFMPMFHLLSIHFQSPVDVSQGFMGGNSQVVMGTRNETDLVAGLSFSKSLGNLDLNLGAWYGGLNHAKQIQNRLGLTFYPLGNLNLYAGAHLNTQYEFGEQDSTLRFTPEVQLGFSLAEKVWVDMKGSVGEMINYLENNGSIVYNSFSEVIRKKFTLTFSVPVSEKGSLLYLGGRWSANESHFFPLDAALEDITNTIAYQTLSIYGGLSWKF